MRLHGSNTPPVDTESPAATRVNTLVFFKIEAALYFAAV